MYRVKFPLLSDMEIKDSIEGNLVYILVCKYEGERWGNVLDAHMLFLDSLFYYCAHLNPRQEVKSVELVALDQAWFPSHSCVHGDMPVLCLHYVNVSRNAGQEHCSKPCSLHDEC